MRMSLTRFIIWCIYLCTISALGAGLLSLILCLLNYGLTLFETYILFLLILISAQVVLIYDYVKAIYEEVRK